MNQTAAGYEQLIERFVTWAQTQRDIRAAIVLGSRARVDHPADEWSDLDILVIATDPERYMLRIDWLENVGNPWLTFLERTGTGDETERRVLFEGGLDVDFALISKRKAQLLVHLLRIRKRFPRLLRLLPKAVRQTMQKVAGFSDMACRGIHVLLDKDGIATHLTTLVSAETPSSHPPTQNEFLEVINDFLYHVVWTAKKLGRGELWTAKGCADSYMKWRCLLRMIEWHARAKKGWDYDTWHGGRFLEEWADPCALEQLRDAFAHYDKEDVQRALFATMELFRWLAMETAERLGYLYPTVADERVTEWVRTCLSEKAGTDS
ncbi:MAG: aminoglycoside 6-adenylyltransferase [Anaerolineae bacterium]